MVHRPEDSASARIPLLLIHRWAVAKRLVMTEKATFEHQALGFDADDVADIIESTDISCVHSVAQDRRFPERTVVVMHVRVEDQRLYIKVSLRLDRDHNVTVLSFHREGS
jgi:hypothetical protein